MKTSPKQYISTADNDKKDAVYGAQKQSLRMQLSVAGKVKSTAAMKVKVSGWELK